MFRFFTPDISLAHAVASKPDPIELMNVLSKLHAKIEFVVDVLSGVLQGSADRTLFDEESLLKQSAADFIDCMRASVKGAKEPSPSAEKIEKYYAVFMGTDFSTWSLKEINELKSFFATFENQSIHLTLDAKHIALLTPEKLTTLLHAIQAATGKIMLRIAHSSAHKSKEEKNEADFYGNRFVGVSKATVNAIFDQLPGVVIKPVEYWEESKNWDGSARSATEALISSKRVFDTVKPIKKEIKEEAIGLGCRIC